MIMKSYIYQIKKITIILLSGLLFSIACKNSNNEKDNSTGETKVKQVEDFVPETWKIIAQDTGDLNFDGADDIALVIQSTDKKNIIANEDFGVPTLDTNPRSLIILF